ncbi:MAG: FHA domain-containing protein [Myxococcota bacterium]
MSERLSILTVRFRENPSPILRQTEPVLVWATAPAAKPKALLWGTLGDYRPEPPSHDPLLYRVEKTSKKANAFGVGITLGRTQNNDLAVDDSTVSRFHAYFQKDQKTGVWHVVDAESHNGTFCDGNRLVPRRPAPLHDGVALRFGYVEMRFLLPEGFAAFMREHTAL